VDQNNYSVVVVNNSSFSAVPDNGNDCIVIIDINKVLAKSGKTLRQE